MKSTKVLTTDITPIDLDSLTNFLIEEKKKKIVFCNVNVVVRSKKDTNIMNVVKSFDIKAPDGFPIVKALNILTKNNFKRTDGYNTFIKTIEKGLESKTRHYFFGNSNEVNEMLVQNLTKTYPNIVISGSFAPEINSVENLVKNYKEVIESLETDIVWVSLGFPKQEIFINSIDFKSTDANIVGVGAVFEWVAKTKYKAPEFLAEIGLEWIFRLVQEPKRLFKRYFVDNTLFIYYFLKQLIFER